MVGAGRTDFGESGSGYEDIRLIGLYIVILTPVKQIEFALGVDWKSIPVDRCLNPITYVLRSAHLHRLRISLSEMQRAGDSEFDRTEWVHGASLVICVLGRREGGGSEQS